jgi:hypothetical protein
VTVAFVHAHSRIIHVVSCHAEGEVGDVIVGGVARPPRGTLWEQSRFVAQAALGYALAEVSAMMASGSTSSVPPDTRFVSSV